MRSRMPSFFPALFSSLLCLGTVLGYGRWAQAAEPKAPAPELTIRGSVQNQDLRRVPLALVQVKDQEGQLIAEQAANDAGEFTVTVPAEGTYSVSAVHETYRSEYVILRVGKEKPAPLRLTLSQTLEVALEVVAPLPPIQYKASSETYSLSRKDIEAIPRGNNIDLNDLLATVPSAVQQPLKQTSIRQDHANIQFRIDGVPIPDTVTSTFADIITPRAWERADIILGGMEAQYGNRTALLVDITSKSGTKPGFGSVQLFGGSNETINPSFEYGGTIGQKFRYYVLNSYTSTSRGIEPPTLGHSVFHDHNERNQSYLRGDYQHDNRNNFTWLFLNSAAKYEIPTRPGLAPDATVLALLQGQDPRFTPVASQSINQFQKENNQYGHMVWRRDVNANNFFSLAGYGRQTRATFKTDPFNGLVYTLDPEEPFSTADQDRLAYSLGVRLDYTYLHSSEHLVKTGFQIDRTQAVTKTQTYAFTRNPATALPEGGVLTVTARNQNIGYRQEFWLQDQWTPDERWTFNLGVRADFIQYQLSEAQVSPRLGVTYKADKANVFHAFYGMMFQPPNLEQIGFANLGLTGTTAQPEDPRDPPTRAERSHYFEVGSYHDLNRWATLEIAGYYKLIHFAQDAGQFGTTPQLNYFSFSRGWQRGIDGALKLQLSDDLSARGNVAWGECKGYGLASGNYLLEQKEINDINSRGGIFCDHSQRMTSSAVVAYRFFRETTLSGQMLYGSGLRSTDSQNADAKTNSSHMPSYTVYNASLTHVFKLPWENQKFLLGFDVVNLLDQQYLYNRSEGSIGLGVQHAGMPRSFFFRGQWFF